MSQRIVVATWNLNWMSRSAESNARKLEYLVGKTWDVLALQEVVPGMAEAIRASGAASAFSYPGDLGRDRFASAILTRGDFTLARSCLIAELPRPNRGITALVKGPGIPFEFLSWHAPNAAKRENRLVKQAGYRAFASWVKERRGPLLVGTDANHGSFYVRHEDFPGSPMKGDFKDDEWLDENLWWTQENPDLRDVWIQFLEERPDVVAKVRSAWKQGPSAVSYTRGSKKNPVPDRFDYVLASPEFAVREVAYDYEGGRAAGSDHAFLSAEVALG